MYLLQDKVELSLGLVHLVAFQEAEVSSPQQMVWVVHDNLVSCGVEEGGLQRGRVSKLVSNLSLLWCQ